VDLRADGRERLSDGSEDPHDGPDRPVSLVHDGRSARRGELGPDEDRPIVGQVLDHPETLHRTPFAPREMPEFIFKQCGIL